eukprot:TCONS_00032003-protein
MAVAAAAGNNRDLGEALRLALENGVIDDVEFLLLADLGDIQLVGGKQRKDYKARWGHFDFDLWTERECWVDCRFWKGDIIKICDMLGLGDEIVTYNYIHCSVVKAFCLLCRRLAFPCRYTDLIPKFGRPESSLSTIFNAMLSHLYERYGWLLRSFEQEWLSRDNLSLFARHVHDRAPLDNCWGFVDGTVRGIARPKRDQRMFYNGHKRKHALKYQAVSAPNGLIAHFYGPIEGSRHDSFMLRESHLLNDLEQYSYDLNGDVLAIYGDAGYPFRDHLQTGFPNPLCDAQRNYNQEMSRVRVTVEWAFGSVIEKFKFTDHKAMQKSLLSPVAKQYIVSALLSNIHTCLYGSNTSQFFECPPPNLEDYLKPRPQGYQDRDDDN